MVFEKYESEDRTSDSRVLIENFVARNVLFLPGSSRFPCQCFPLVNLSPINAATLLCALFLSFSGRTKSREGEASSVGRIRCWHRFLLIPPKSREVPNETGHILCIFGSVVKGTARRRRPFFNITAIDHPAIKG